MGVISYEVPINVQRMTIGVQGENNVREFLFDVTEWRNLTGDIGAAEMVVQRNGDSSPYAAVITMHDENTVSWVPTSTDTEKVGAGKLQLMWIAGGQTVKTKIFDMKVDPALDYQLPDDSLNPWASWVPDVINAAVIVKEFPGSVADATADWLEEHIGPTTPAIDKSLSIEGAGADAKKTGEEIADLKSALNDIMVADSIFVKDFWITSTGAWQKINGYSLYVFPVSPGDEISIKGGTYAVKYTFLKTYSSPVVGTVLDYATGYSQFATKSYDFALIAPNDAHYLIIGNNDANVILPIWAKNGDYDYIKSTIENHNNNASNIIRINSYPTSGYIDTSGGIIGGGAWVTTDYYPFVKVKDIYLKAYQLPGTVAIASFYDTNKSFVYAIDTVSGTTGNGEKSGYINLSGVPSSAKFVRFSTNNNSHYAIVKYTLSDLVIENFRNASEAQNNIILSAQTITSFISNGHIRYTDGGISPGANFVYTDYLSAKYVESIRSKAYQYPQIVALVAFYDENKAFISAVDLYDGMSGQGNKEGSISISQIPSNAVFMRFSSYASIQDKYVSIKYNYTEAFKDIIIEVPEVKSDLENIDAYKERLIGYPFSMAFIGDSLTHGSTYVADQGTAGYAYKNKSNYPEAFGRLLDLDSKTVIAIPGANPGGVWSSKRSEIEAIRDQFVIVWLGTNGGLTDTVNTDCVGNDVDSYANTNTGNYGKIVKTLASNGNKVFLAQLCYLTHSTASNPVIVKLADRFECSVLELTPDDITDLNQDKYHTAYNGYINSVHFNAVGYNHVAGLFFNKMMKLVYANPAKYEIRMVDEQ